MHRIACYVRLRQVVLLLLILTTIVSAQGQEFELLLRGGKVIDGTGAPWYYADIGIRDGKISRIGPIKAEAGQTILDVKGCIVAPGFIDMMGQSATPMMNDANAAMNLLTQGITTINAGEGGSSAPLSADDARRSGWATMAEYFTLLEMQGLPINVVQTVGHTQVRRIVLGDTDRRPSDKEMEQMRQLVREGMEAGAIGVSTALIYPPAVYAQTREIAELAKVAGEYGGGYYTHMRNEGDQLLEAIDEALEIGRLGNTPVHIFHLKTAGRANWPKMPLAIAKIHAARAAGFQVAADIYPYVNNGLGIGALIHPRHFAEGREALLAKLDDPLVREQIRQEMEQTEGWENWFRHVGHDWSRVVIGKANHERYERWNGKSIAEMAGELNEDPWETFFQLVRSDAFALPQSMSEANKILAMQQPFISFCTDVGPASGDRSTSHPRAYGSFPRVFARYVRETGVLSWEQAIARASSVAANEVFIRDRGRIAEGLAADLVVFDPDTFLDQATFAKPEAVAIGMRYVVVNGRLVLEDGKLTSARPGRVLRGPGYDPRTATDAVSVGETPAGFESFDRHIPEFQRKHRSPGIAVAVTDQGKVVFSRGYGYGDVATRERVTPQSLFRIASLSKPITAVAILKLVDAGKLQLDDRVVDLLPLEPWIAEAGDRFDARFREITVRHLLQHRGGWDRDKSFDAMFQSVRFADELGVAAPAGPEIVIRAMFRQSLDFDPGARYAYSNYGYCLLGRVIEQVTGQSYESYVREQVLAPLGITQMRIGVSRLEDRAAGEVRYYQPGIAKSVFKQDLGQSVPWPYGGWYLEAMDAHGGWIASVEDLARFHLALDAQGDAALLTPASREAMYARPDGAAGHNDDGSEKEVYYSLGWQNRDLGEGRINHWHTGSLSGTATIMIRRHDGKNLIALMNTRVSPESSHLGREIDSLLHRALDETMPNR